MSTLENNKEIVNETKLNGTEQNERSDQGKQMIKKKKVSFTPLGEQTRVIMKNEGYRNSKRRSFRSIQCWVY